MDLSTLYQPKSSKTHRISSWDITGRNADFWQLKPGETRILADIAGPGKITHIWFTQPNHYRECVIKMTWDEASAPSPL
jgi:hypothetical protein